MEDALACMQKKVLFAEEQLFPSMRMELIQHVVSYTKVSNLHAEQLAVEQRETSSLIAEDELIVGKENRIAVDEGSKTRDTAKIEEEEVGEAAEDKVQEPTVNCSEYPVFCDSKLNCSGNPITVAESVAWGKQLVTADGHANLRSWCMVYPSYATALPKCILEDSKLEYAKAMYEFQTIAQSTEADGAYCFGSGLCNNTKVTLNTTLQEAEGICSARYGDRWKGIGWADLEGPVAPAVPEMYNHSPMPRQIAELFAMAACAMGNYQCDVFYCKVNYCQNDDYLQRFGNLSWAVA